MPNRFFFKMKSLSKTIALVFVTTALTLFPLPVLAGFQPVGFQWVAPAEPVSPPAYAPPANSSECRSAGSATANDAGTGSSRHASALFIIHAAYRLGRRKSRNYFSDRH